MKNPKTNKEKYLSIKCSKRLQKW